MNTIPRRILFPELAIPRLWLPLVLPVCVLCVAYALLALTTTDQLSHGEIMQRCVLMDPRRARISSVGNVEIGLAYFGVFGGMIYYFLAVYARSRQHIIDVATATAYLLGSFALDYFCVRLFQPFVALLIGDIVVMVFTLAVSRQIWFTRLLGIFVPIVFLTCGIGHFLEGLSFWRQTYMLNTPWTMVTADVGFAILVNASRFPAFIRGEDVVAELMLATNRAEALQTEVDAHVRRISDYAGALEAQMVEIAAANAKLESLAHTDALTGIRNRLAFDERLQLEMESAQREGSSLALLIFDVDHFKGHNDSYGHPAGDVVLTHVARILQEGDLDAGLVARIGGEEFALILPRTSANGAAMTAERLRGAIENHPWPQGVVTVSVGGSELHTGESSRKPLLSRADAALYVSKARGRNCVTVA